MILVFKKKSFLNYYLPDFNIFSDDTDVIKATGIVEQDQSLQLNRICQLTGFSDPIYAEAYVNVHQYDIVLDVIVVNQTAETLQNVALELATLGDLKLVERPQTYTIGPHSKTNIKVNIKVGLFVPKIVAHFCNAGFVN